MWWFIPSFFSVLTVFAGIIAFAFLTLCLATGLYYLAELVEEYSVLTRKALRWSIIGVIGIHALLWLLEGLPFFETLVGIGAHVWYYTLLDDFPFIELLTFKFIGACACLAIDHFTWFRYFTGYYHPFNHILSFFLLCVWSVPFGFFVSLSAGEESLPHSMSQGDVSADGGSAQATDSRVSDSELLASRPVMRSRVNRVLQLFQFFSKRREALLPIAAASDSKRV